jgi:hypothetical protein
MKMRVQGNAIRFRLNRREVEDFARTGRASACVNFPGGAQLLYTLERSSSAHEVEASFIGGEVLIRVPEGVAQSWACSDEVSLTGEQALESGDRLAIIVEKDFQCMHKGEEGKDPDAYPNPMAAA